MGAKEFILKSIKSIVKEIPGISIRYAFEKNTNFHIVEVEPEDIRRGDNQYMEMESRLWDDFFSNYPNEDLLISERDELNDMSNLICESSSAGNYIYMPDKVIEIELPESLTELTNEVLARLIASLVGDPIYLPSNVIQDSFFQASLSDKRENYNTKSDYKTQLNDDLLNAA
jgi:predicted PolB exonuclease-like 3'-5' exonuclease